MRTTMSSDPEPSPTRTASGAETTPIEVARAAHARLLDVIARACRASCRTVGELNAELAAEVQAALEGYAGALADAFPRSAVYLRNQYLREDADRDEGLARDRRRVTSGAVLPATLVTAARCHHCGRQLWWQKSSDDLRANGDLLGEATCCGRTYVARGLVVLVTVARDEWAEDESGDADGEAAGV